MTVSCVSRCNIFFFLSRLGLILTVKSVIGASKLSTFYLYEVKTVSYVHYCYTYKRSHVVFPHQFNIPYCLQFIVITDL
jgi:hypothetical protein